MLSLLKPGSTRLMIIYVSMMLLLTGCMYPDELREENQVSPGEFVVVVQQAVERYQESHSVLPIKNSGLDTPIYEKYVIDFKKLMDYGYLSTIPTDAFENGGSAYYVLVNVEESPEVKLMDLVVKQQVGEVQRDISSYQSNHDGQLPLGELVAEGFYRIDYDKLGVQAVQIQSPYSRQFLSLLVHKSGEVFIDYASDIMLAKDKIDMTTPDIDMDLRTWLVETSYYVPVSSMPYYWMDERPQIVYE